MATFVIRNGKVVNKQKALAKGVKSVHVISDEMSPTRHMADGNTYTSKKKFRDATRAAGCIERDLAVVVAAKGLVWLWQFKAKCFQRFFLLWGNFTIFILTVEHMALMDVGRPLVQMERPI